MRSVSTCSAMIRAAGESLEGPYPLEVAVRSEWSSRIRSISLMFDARIASDACFAILRMSLGSDSDDTKSLTIPSKVSGGPPRIPFRSPWMEYCLDSTFRLGPVNGLLGSNNPWPGP